MQFDSLQKGSLDTIQRKQSKLSSLHFPSTPFPFSPSQLNFHVTIFLSSSSSSPLHHRNLHGLHATHLPSSLAKSPDTLLHISSSPFFPFRLLFRPYSSTKMSAKISAKNIFIKGYISTFSRNFQNARSRQCFSCLIFYKSSFNEIKI